MPIYKKNWHIDFIINMKMKSAKSNQHDVKKEQYWQVDLIQWDSGQGYGAGGWAKGKKVLVANDSDHALQCYSEAIELGSQNHMPCGNHPAVDAKKQD